MAPPARSPPACAPWLAAATSRNTSMTLAKAARAGESLSLSLGDAVAVAGTATVARPAAASELDPIARASRASWPSSGKVSGKAVNTCAASTTD